MAINDPNLTGQQAAPAERGRYALYPHPGGQGWMISRATGTCDRCTTCGCGDQQEVIDLSPGGVAGLIKRARGLGKMKGALKI
jgi:hypothetical protein